MLNSSRDPSHGRKIAALHSSFRILLESVPGRARRGFQRLGKQHPVNTSAAGHHEITQQYGAARVSQIYAGTKKVMKFTVE